MIDTTFTLSEEEFVAGQKLYQRVAIKKAKKQNWNVAALSLLSILGAVLLQRETSGFLLTPLALTLVLPVSLLAGTVKILFKKSHLRDAYNRNLNSFTNLRVLIDESGYRFEILDLTHGFVSWRAFTCWMEDSTLFLLGRGTLFYPIPKSALNVAETDELRILIAAHVKTTVNV